MFELSFVVSPYSIRDQSLTENDNRWIWIHHRDWYCRFDRRRNSSPMRDAVAVFCLDDEIDRHDHRHRRILHDSLSDWRRLFDGFFVCSQMPTNSCRWSTVDDELFSLPMQNLSMKMFVVVFGSISMWNYSKSVSIV